MWPNESGRPLAAHYGDYMKIGEVIGVLLEFNEGKGSLTYFRNGKSFGKAFDLPSGKYFPCVSMLNNEQTNV